MRLARVTLHVLLQRLMNASADGTPTSSSWLGNNGGCYPKQHSKGESLEAADVWLLIAYSAQGNCELHETRIIRAQTSQHGLHSLVSPLGLAIRLWVESGW